MAAFQLIILLSIGSFQAQLPAVSKLPSPSFDDSAAGAVEFVKWAKATIPAPKFGQPPLQICVVGALPFTPDQAPYLPKPLWESRQPLRSLEPYAATFHYVAAAPGAKPPRPRAMRDALKICAAAAKKP